MHVDFVAHVRIEVPFALEPFSKVSLPFFKKVGINGAFLINGNQFLKLTFGELRAGYRHYHARSLRYLQENPGAVLCRIVVSPANVHTRAEMAFFRQELSDPVRAMLQSCGGDGLARPQLEPRENACVLVGRVIL